MATALSRSRAMATKRTTRHYYSTHNLASTVSFGMLASVNHSDHGRVVRIFVCLSKERYCHRKSKRALEQWRPTARQKSSYLHHQGEFQHNYFDFVSLHHSDHDGVVRIFVGHSEVVKRLLFRLFRLDYLDYITRHNFSYTRSVIIYAAQFSLYQECNNPLNIEGGKLGKVGV